jgi:hypothetical protein
MCTENVSEMKETYSNIRHKSKMLSANSFKQVLYYLLSCFSMYVHMYEITIMTSDLSCHTRCHVGELVTFLVF